jgi:hypothetical protein
MRMMSVLLLLGLIWPGAAPAAQLRLTWTDNSSNEAGFLIERRAETEDTFTPLTTVGMNITAYVDPTVEAGITYCYQVRAFAADGDSAPSTEVCGPGQ